MKRLFYLVSFLLLSPFVAAMNAPLSLQSLALKELAHLHASNQISRANLTALANKDATDTLIADLPSFSKTASRDLKRLTISLSRYLQRKSNDWGAAYLSIHWPEDLQGMEKWEKLCKSSLSAHVLTRLEALKKKDPSYFKNNKQIYFVSEYIDILFSVDFYDPKSKIFFLQKIIKAVVESGNPDSYRYLQYLLAKCAQRQSIQQSSPQATTSIGNHYEVQLDRGLSEKDKKSLLPKIMKECNFAETNYLVREFYDDDVNKWWPESAKEKRYMFCGRIWGDRRVPSQMISPLGSIYKHIIHNEDSEEVIKKLLKYTNEEKVTQYLISLCIQRRYKEVEKIFYSDLVDVKEFLFCCITKYSFEYIKRNLWSLIQLLDIQFEELYSFLDDGDLQIKWFKLFYGEKALIVKLQKDFYSSLNDLDKLQGLKNLNSSDLKKAIQGLNNDGEYTSPIQIAFGHEDEKLLELLLQMGFKVPKIHMKYLKLSQYPGGLIQMAMQYDALPKVDLHSIVLERYPLQTNDLLKILDLGLFSNDFRSKSALSKLVIYLVKKGNNFGVIENILGRGILDLDFVFDQNHPSRTLFSACEKALKVPKDINKIPTLKKYKDKKLLERKKRYFKTAVLAVGASFFSYVGYTWLKSYFSS